ncbi:TIGR02391 family protein [Leptolyngbya sp. PCC 6406]|uniref:TIGR02391 family protein n=1 Tax=Leptolyngbya sp. PCC 6406 TaxID=1173264 RepID=UPI0002AC054A|nr:TIGR02391 family protein [Leptolyngbya sp. PCC 6406]
MQPLNLTETQKNLLQWLVEQVRAGILNEEEIWFIWISGRTSLVGYQENVPEVKSTTLDALQSGGCLSCDRSRQHQYKCALTSKAYEAVDSNFSAPNLSAIPHLIPLIEVKHLDPTLWERCRFSLSVGGDDPKAWDQAVRTAMVVLEERLRELGRTESINPGATGEGIVNLIFAGKNPVLAGKLDEKQRKGYRDLYAGMMAVFRNHYAHRIIDPSPEVGGAIIAFINLLLKILNDVDWDSICDERGRSPQIRT